MEPSIHCDFDICETTSELPKAPENPGGFSMKYGTVEFRVQERRLLQKQVNRKRSEIEEIEDLEEEEEEEEKEETLVEEVGCSETCFEFKIPTLAFQCCQISSSAICGELSKVPIEPFLRHNLRPYIESSATAAAERSRCTDDFKITVRLKVLKIEFPQQQQQDFEEEEEELGKSLYSCW